MTFKDSVKSCLGKYVTFAGRASRSEYWWFTLFIWVGSAALFTLGIVLSKLFGLDGNPALDQTRRIGAFFILPAILPAVFFLAMFLPSLSAQVRRFHDRDMSGWWILAFMVLGMVPYIGRVMGFATLFITIPKGKSGANRFGPDPLVAEHSADVFA